MARRRYVVPRKFTPALQQMFIEHLRKHGVIGEAALFATVSRKLVLNQRKDFPEFDQEVREAMVEHADVVETELLRRAVEGIDEPVFYKGEQVATVKKYSDRLLELAIKSKKPEYRDKSQLSVAMSGGVLIVPGIETDEDTWHRQHEGGKDAKGEKA